MIYNVIVKSNSSYYSYDSLGGWLEINEPQDEQDYIDYGFDMDLLPDVTEEQWAELTNISILFFTDDPDVEEITIETETGEFTIYDEFGDSMEVVYYTDDENVEEAELEIIANYSPLDELEGDFEVVTWTDDDNAELELEMKALPVAQFVYQTTPHEISGFFKGYEAEEKDSNKDKGIIRYLVSPDKQTWKTWGEEEFVNVNIEDNNSITDSGMDYGTLNNISEVDWEQWEDEYIYIGVFLEENIRDTDEVLVDKISLTDLVPTETTKVSNAKLYILNTVSTIDVTFVGRTLTGEIDDEDEGKVQYRILLNDEPYYPTDGSFTPLMASPLNISTTLDHNKIKMDENNVLRIEFHDYWGSTDYWETNFIGTYNGLLFLDEAGEYYSTDIGEILKYLDFGAIIAGQTTLEHKIILRNTYGYPVKDINIKANQSKFPSGLKAQFGTNDTSFESLNEINHSGELKDGEEIKFFIRLSSDLETNSVPHGEFDIIVTANKVDETE